MRSYSPLRYPGGKGQIYSYMSDLLEKNNLIGCTYIEPYAGGAGLAIRLLFDNKVNKVIINDYDRGIYSVWYCILNRKDEFIDLINNAVFNIEEWRRQKIVQSNKEFADILDLAFSTFYLNRTNRSGIIKAGVIGGINQDGNYLMDCRFNKVNLIQLINKIYDYRNRISIYNSDAIVFMNQIKYYNNKFFFIDPPYYNKGKDLYTNFYTHDDHVNLSIHIIKKLKNNKYLLSYDHCTQISLLYKNSKSSIEKLNYYVGSNKNGNELFITNNIDT